MRKDCHLNTFCSPEDEEHIADIPDLKYCSASGARSEEALHDVLEAKALWLEVAQDKGLPVPEPRYRPAIYQLSAQRCQIPAVRELETPTK